VKVLFSFVFVGFLSVSVFATQPSEELIQALITVESNGNDNAHGDLHLKAQAYGCLQIRQPVCDDVNRKLGTHYQAEEMLGQRELSVKICKIYIDIYATAKRLGHEPTNEDMARIWNGGPQGWKRSSTVAYWEKVRAKLGE
jgi:hypothetical protein